MEPFSLSKGKSAQIPSHLCTHRKPCNTSNRRSLAALQLQCAHSIGWHLCRQQVMAYQICHWMST